MTFYKNVNNFNKNGLILLKLAPLHLDICIFSCYSKKYEKITYFSIPVISHGIALKCPKIIFRGNNSIF